MTNAGLKQRLTTDQLAEIQCKMERKKKSESMAAILWLFTGAIGGHRYYNGNIMYAVCMTATLGGLGVWTVIDLFHIRRAVEKKNIEIEREIISKL